MNIKSQRGAVLAFSLVMLLLLTLAATRMIQQNKQQLEMANNARLLTQEFANSEGVLADAQNIINTNPAHIDPSATPLPPSEPNHQCVPISDVYKQHILPAGVINNSAKILTASCLSSTGTTKCTDYVGTTLTCYPKSAGASGTDCTGKTIDEIAALFSDPTDVCYQPYDPQCNEDLSTTTNPRCLSIPSPDLSKPDHPCGALNFKNFVYDATTNKCIYPSPYCPKEVYKIQVISTSDNGATREIISDHVVGCGT